MTKKKYVRKTVTWEGRRYEVRAETEREAVEKLAVLKDQLRRGEKTDGENRTVASWFREWMDVYKIPSGISTPTIDMYERMYRKFIDPMIGRMQLRSVHDIHLQRIMNSLQGYSYSQAHKLHLILKGMFRQARISRLIVFDPSEALALPAVTSGTRRSLTDPEREALLRAAESHRCGLFFLTLLYTGLRPGEAAALQWRDVDWEKNEIHVYKAMAAKTDEIKDPKSAAGFRDIPIHADLRDRLLAAKGDPFAPVFPNSRGGPMSSRSRAVAWESFKKVMSKHIPGGAVAADLTTYCLRHTFCTDLQRAGVPITVAKDLMGHANISMTANIYTHKDQNLLHEGIQRLSSVGTSVGLKTRNAGNT